MSAIKWEDIPGTNGYLQRSRTPTGWLVREVQDCAHIGNGKNEYITTGYDWRVALTFVPDPDGVWLKDEVSTSGKEGAGDE